MSRIEINAAVMFADICGSTHLYERLGDGTAHHLVSNLIKLVDSLIEKHNGRVVKHIGDEVLAVFEKLENAASCAIHIHKLSEDEKALSSLQMKIGIRFGAVFLENSDVFGDTVNTAARIVSMATPGQTLVGAEISGIELKSGAIRSIGLHKLKGKKNVVEIYELLGAQPKGLTTCVAPSRKNRRKERVLRLCFADTEIEMVVGQKIIIGRDEQNALRIDHHLVSREHAEVEGVRDRFVLRDISTNGLTVLASDGREYALHREGITLVGNGEIHLGTQSASSSDVPIVRFVNAER
ncbi:adenylate/guanylate cyclase domain-containing protein [Propionivibrio sp.]|uniref:adenylate/guanylate cyclase domain-containing protein n=1 Tax=Propionivibrio sp. TaxID=2212460 RepID=UPI003BF2DDB5